MQPTFDRWLIRGAAWAVALIMVLVPFHALLTVWLSQLVGHYTLLRLWKECLLVPLCGVALYLIFTKPALRARLLKWKLAWFIGTFLAVQIIWGIAALALHQVSLQALGYGWITDSRFLVFFLVAWVVGVSVPQFPSWWPKLAFPAAAIVITFGLLQFFVLPYDFLKHLGYSAATIFPYEDINHNLHYLRVMSTLRGANPLGAYLLVVLCLLVAAWPAHYQWDWWIQKRRVAAAMALLGVTGCVVLILTFSRAAWLGFGIGLLVLLWVGRPMARLQLVRTIMLLGGSLVVAVAVFWALFGNNPVVQNVLLHTQANSPITTTSNEGHSSALTIAVSEVVHEPLGRGPGTAGPASVYNTGHPLRIAENYFLQVGQETGWLGLGLFVSIMGLVGYELWRRRTDPLAIGLFASLFGLVIVNLLSHAWADDTLAYVWWGLAAFACVSPLAASKPKR